MYIYLGDIVKYIFNIIILLSGIIVTLYNEKIMIEKYIVEIKGEVIRPGTYRINKGDRISDLINYSGGLTNNANTSNINMSKKLNDEDVVIISSVTDTKIVYVENNCSCPVIKPIGCINILNNEIVNLTSKVSLNSATKEELMQLNGIGESKALEIIKYREENNGFKSIDEITNVKGIGKSLYEKNKHNLTL